MAKAPNTYPVAPPVWTVNPEDRFPQCCYPTCRNKARDFLAIHIPWATSNTEQPLCPVHMEELTHRMYPEGTECQIRSI